MERHRRTYEATRATADARSGFEMRIKRRWWHYKPLDPEQLLTWWLYLDSVQGEGDEHVTYGLFERCLVPCASYPGVRPAHTWRDMSAMYYMQLLLSCSPG